MTTTKYIGKAGNVIGQADDEILITAESHDEAMRRLRRWSDAHWPDSDCPYSAVIWLESADGDVIDSEAVEINADGTRNRQS